LKYTDLHEFLRCHLRDLTESGEPGEHPTVIVDRALTIAFGVVLTLRMGDKLSAIEIVKNYFDNIEPGIKNGDIEPPYLGRQTLQ